MSILIGFLYVVEVVVCLLLALVVMLQKPKEGGLGGLAGGMG
ncbi:MAG: preprotein translocase subunit SecG, partial [bacterium]|nr:preprotein translocase subunit SecG [bacterium]